MKEQKLKGGQNFGLPCPLSLELLSQLKFDPVDSVKLQLTHQRNFKIEKNEMKWKKKRKEKKKGVWKRKDEEKMVSKVFQKSSQKSMALI